MMMKRFCCAVLLSAVAFIATAGASWLPLKPNAKVQVRLLGCEYSGSRLVKCEDVSDGSANWNVSIIRDSVQGGINYVFTAKRAMKQVGVAVAVSYTHLTLPTICSV